MPSQRLDPKQWLNTAQLYPNPFARPGTDTETLTRAEEENEDYLDSFFTASAIQPNFGGERQRTHGDNGEHMLEDLMARDRHGVLVAGTGEGKTATRRMLALNLQKKDQLDSPIIVVYTDFDRIWRSAEDHAQKIIDKLVMLPQYLSVPSSSEWNSAASATDRLTRLCQALNQLIFVLIDPDESPFGGVSVTTEDRECAIEHLFDMRLWNIPNLRFKLFVHRSLAPQLRTYQVLAVESRTPVDIFHMEWNTTALNTLVERRISSVSSIAGDLAHLTKAEGDKPFLLVAEAIRCVAGKDGAPRLLIRLMNEVIRIHINRSSEDNFLITRADFEAAAQYMGDLCDGGDSAVKTPTVLPPDSPPPVDTSKSGGSDKPPVSVRSIVVLIVIIVAAILALVIPIRQLTGDGFLVLASLIFLVLILFPLVAAIDPRLVPKQFLPLYKRVIDIAGGAQTDLFKRISDWLDSSINGNRKK